MRRKHRIRAVRGTQALMLAALLALTPFTGISVRADEAAEETSDAEEQETFVIESAADWETFAEAAHADVWSRGRTVRLASDIVLTGETARIVYFAGVFEGGGHTIEGVSIRAERSGAGLFEQLADGGTIRDLRVIGAVYPTGRSETVGGIVGINRGAVENCSFFGGVDAHSKVGGIVGQNEESGVIADCTAGGVVQGDTEAGGIVGYNIGMVQGCTNEAKVNTVYTDVPFSTEDLTLTLDEILQTGRITTPDNADQKTDIGGIAGFSVGILERCANRGEVGYEHVGFSVGGIAGRSTGLVMGCTNDGEVFGRRKVGGIVGQQQPDLSISFSEGKLGEIDTALDDLQVMIDAALTDTENYSNDASDLLYELSRLTGVAKGDVKTLTDDATAQADTATARANSATSDVKKSAQDLSDASEDIGAASSKIIDYAGREANADVSGSATNDALDAIAKAYLDMNSKVSAILSLIDSAGNNEAVRKTDFYQDLITVQDVIAEAVKGTAGESSSASLNLLQSGAAARESVTAAELATLISEVGVMQTALSQYLDDNWNGNTGCQLDVRYAEFLASEDADVKTVVDSLNTEDKNTTIPGAIQTMQDDKNAVGTRSGTGSLNDLVTIAGDSAESQAPSSSEVEAVGKDLSNASKNMESAFDRLSGLDLTVNGVSATARAASSDLYATIDRMLTESDALNASLRGAASGTVGNLKGINAQMGYLSDLIEEAVEDELNRSVDPADYTEDVSGEDFASATSGRTTACKNTGAVNADGDVGGIAGLMGVDSELDPERDITTLTNRTTDATMLEKAIVDDCENSGRVVSGGNYAGGITGRMQLGIVYGSRDLGMIDSDAEYAGGIVGFSGATVKDCLVKAHIRAQGYAGGIAGSGDVLTGNRAMVRIADAVQFAGAVAGAASEISAEKLADNLWCGGGIHAIGDVDYAGLAEEADYETITEDDLGMFRSLRLTFLADEEEVGEVLCGYGASVPAGEIPDVPEKDGFFGAWARTDFNNVTEEDRIEAVYTRVATLIACPWTREDGREAFFAEGAFQPGDAITLLDYQRTMSVDDETPMGERFSLRLPEGATGVHRFRFLPDPSMGDVTVQLASGDAAVELDTSTMGAYLTFEAPGQEVVFVIGRKENVADYARNHALPIGIAAGGAGAAILTGVLLRRKKKRL